MSGLALVLIVAATLAAFACQVLVAVVLLASALFAAAC